ncbi:MAG: RagB/SusD family nutrient uptake outer membrane protein [Bacteroidaceae bacterium]|nr:RagB/SusD family nutrient uptake outer membrane protein [Bacteroidaceae bacterium]
MNNILSKFKALSFMMLAFAFASCNDFLDENPDDRVVIDEVEKIQKLLVYAYPETSISFLTEYSSDNVTDNGRAHTAQNSQDEVYRFEQDIEESNDDPKNVWETHYNAVATANKALDAIAELGENEKTLPLKAEALLCRAYAIFSLTNCFCMAYDSLTANQYLGIPYPKVSYVSVNSRGTLAETYANIDADIEAALPLIDDSYLKVAAAYHFNRRAAYAFAARFNLFYQRYKKARQYACEALGSNSLDYMRTSLSTYGELGMDGIQNAYVNSSEPANFLLVAKYSIMGRTCYASNYERYNHNQQICQYETYWAHMPWNATNASNNNTLYESKMIWGNEYLDFTPFVLEFFETTSQINRTGFTHIVETAFTGDETALVRAEANILIGTKGSLDSAMVDINNFVLAHCAEKDGEMKRPTLDIEGLKEFWDKIETCKWELNKKSGKIEMTAQTPKKLISKRFKLNDNQMALLYTVLQMRRIETVWKGMRFQDLKRWGIEFIHPIDREQTIVFKDNDLRGAIQLPQDVIDAGLEKNPR